MSSLLIEDGVDIRSPPTNSPVKDLTSPDLVCNVNGGTEVGSFVTAAAGDKVSIEWFHDNRNDDIIDGSHKGPIITYIAPYTSTNGASAIWTKIAEDGFDGTQWAIDKLKANQGKNDITIPSSLAAGKYLLRQEIIALHEADATFDVDPVRGAQFYPGCIQLEVTGSGTAVPSQNFDFNTGYTYADPGIHFNLYTTFTSYPIPGPEVDTLEGGSSNPAPAQSSSVAVVVSTSSSVAVAEPTVAVPTTSVPTAGTTFATVVPSSSVVALPEISEAPAPTAAPTTTTVPIRCGGVRTITRRALH